MRHGDDRASALAAAVCEAGGLGTIGSDINPPDVLRDLVRQTKTLTRRPFGVDLIGDFVTDEHVSVLIEEQVALAIFFWTLPTPGHVERLKQAGIKVWMQIGRVAEAEQAAARGADALIVQGAEAGGHNRAEASTMTLFPRIRRRFPGLPLLAAGGIVDGATMAAALVLGPTPYGAAVVSSLRERRTRTIPTKTACCPLTSAIRRSSPSTAPSGPISPCG